MQNLQSIRVGDRVTVRRQRWRVIEIRAYDECRLLTLAGIGAINSAFERRFLLPFETVHTLDRQTPARVVSPRRWRRACRALLADHAPPGALRTACAARFDLLPHQLEPALAIVRGHGSRVLLADEVGLGKTIQAGLIVKELQARGFADRILILTPAGLREQWTAELSDRFACPATIVDSRELRRRSAVIPIGVNPWSTIPVAIASIDFVKRADVLPSVLACHWDLLAVDEAHGAARDSDRRAAVSTLARRTAYVVLLTATPHDGDERAFNTLCGIGSHGDRLLVFRRSRADVHLGASRRVHQLHVRPSAAEARMHARLADFTRTVRAEHGSNDALLALSVLHKRALSSAWALARSVERRLAALTPDADDHMHQLALPLSDQSGELDRADEAPDCLADLALGDRRLEQRLLLALQTSTNAAIPGETKIAAILRLISRAREPVVIFTEFRDTLLHLQAVLTERVRLTASAKATAVRRSAPDLEGARRRKPDTTANSTTVGRVLWDPPDVSILHGGMTREERRAALDDFVGGRRSVLLATDAAGEGLNLHQRCRIVVNLELPWNPMRLEQRIGRVDRIGQHRTVHVFHLIARSTPETTILERLTMRIDRARQRLAVSNPLENDRSTVQNDERAVARLVIDGSDDEESAVCSQDREATAAPPDVVLTSFAAEAAAETDRLSFARQLSAVRGDPALEPPDVAGPWLVRARLRTTRIRLQGRALALLRIDYEDGHGRVLDWRLVPIAFLLVRDQCWTLKHVKALLRSNEGAVRTLVCDAAGCLDEVGRHARRLAETRRAREQAIIQVLADSPSTSLQPGLFDRRAETAWLSERASVEDAREMSAARLAWCDRISTISERPAELLLVLVP